MMKELRLEVEELEPRIAPSCALIVGIGPIDPTPLLLPDEAGAGIKSATAHGAPVSCEAF